MMSCPIGKAALSSRLALLPIESWLAELSKPARGCLKSCRVAGLVQLGIELIEQANWNKLQPSAALLLAVKLLGLLTHSAKTGWRVFAG